MIALDKDGLRYFWHKLKSRLEGMEARAASDIPTNKPNMSVQDVLDAQSILGEGAEKTLGDLRDAMADLEARALADVRLFTLASGAWALNVDTGVWEQSLESSFFASDNYSYHIAVSPELSFAAADLGGVIMIRVEDQGALFQCQRQPDIDIAVQIERTVLQE